MKVDKNFVGNRIKEIRLSHGWSLEAFGEKLENPPVKPGIISRWENGISLPNNKRLKAIADLANITVEELLHGQQDKKLTVINLEKSRRILNRSIHLSDSYDGKNEEVEKLRENALDLFLQTYYAFNIDLKEMGNLDNRDEVGARIFESAYKEAKENRNSDSDEELAIKLDDLKGKIDTFIKQKL